MNKINIISLAKKDEHYIHCRLVRLGYLPFTSNPGNGIPFFSSCFSPPTPTYRSLAIWHARRRLHARQFPRSTPRNLFRKKINPEPSSKMNCGSSRNDKKINPEGVGCILFSSSYAVFSPPRHTKNKKI
jgi:hypothetical protein